MALEWDVDLPPGQGRTAVRWVQRRLADVDVSRLKLMRINRGSSRYHGVYGRCYYPTQRLPFYRISCQLPGPFPCRIRTRKPPLYAQADGTFPKAPPGCRRTVAFRDVRTGRSWCRVVGSTELCTLDEAVVWIVAHEMFHFLRHSRQVSGRNNEIEADAFADAWLTQFRETEGSAPQPPAVRRGLARFAKTLFDR